MQDPQTDIENAPVGTPPEQPALPYPKERAAIENLRIRIAERKRDLAVQLDKIKAEEDEADRLYAAADADFQCETARVERCQQLADQANDVTSAMQLNAKVTEAETLVKTALAALPSPVTDAYATPCLEMMAQRTNEAWNSFVAAGTRWSRCLQQWKSVRQAAHDELQAAQQSRKEAEVHRALKDREKARVHKASISKRQAAGASQLRRDESQLARKEDQLVKLMQRREARARMPEDAPTAEAAAPKPEVPDVVKELLVGQTRNLMRR